MAVNMKQEAARWTRTLGHCSEDKASVHGKSAPPIETVCAPIYIHFNAELLHLSLNELQLYLTNCEI